MDDIDRRLDWYTWGRLTPQMRFAVYKWFVRDGRDDDVTTETYGFWKGSVITSRPLESKE